MGEDSERSGCGRTSLHPHQWREKNIHLAASVLWLMLDRNVKLYLLVLPISAILVAFAPLYIWGKPAEEVLAS